MRIIAGEFRGRSLQPPPDRRTRPTADRVREAWFSILSEEWPGALVVDLYAGSGALGLEALSRGARSVEFVERGRSALSVLRQNIANLDAEDRVRVHRADALRFAEALNVDAFDIALADPPYAGDGARRLVACFEGHPFARILTVEHHSRDDVGGQETRRYGDAALTFCYQP